MLLRLFLAFTLIPITELYLLIKIGHYLGAFTTILIVIGTGFLGAYLARLQGIRSMMRIRESMSRGEVPAEEMIDAMLIFIAGIVLLTPGLITDIAGLLILMPIPRMHFKRWLRKKLDQWIAENKVHIIMP
ncbi:MAG: FxsA family protein [Pseudomonadota bacterium]